MKYTYSRQIVTPEGVETFTANECASFDEAKKVVDRGVYDRNLEFKGKFAGAISPRKVAEKLEISDNSSNEPAADNVQDSAQGTEVLDK